MNSRIGLLLGELRALGRTTSPTPYLPEIIRSLEAMAESTSASPARREKMARALERLVTEDFAFSESEIGGKLLLLADDFASG